MRTLKNFILTLVTAFVTTMSFGQVTFNFLNSDRDDIITWGWDGHPDNEEVIIDVFITDTIKISGPYTKVGHLATTPLEDRIDFVFNSDTINTTTLFNGAQRIDTLSFIEIGYTYIIIGDTWIKVNVINENDTTSTASITENKTTVTSLNAYPNPVVHYLNIEFETTETEVVVNVFNSTAQLIYTDNQMRYFGSNNITVPMSNQPSGLYFLEIVSDRAVKTIVKVVKE